MNLADDLQKLQQLRQEGAITEEEFGQAKARLLSAAPEAQDLADVTEARSAALEQETRQWALFLHLSLLAGYVIPFGGLIVPIVLWQVKKAELPGIDEHGKNAVNWIISKLIYLVGSGILVLILIGIPMFIIVCVLGIVFPVIAAIKANNGEVWKYPLAIPFFK